MSENKITVKRWSMDKAAKPQAIEVLMQAENLPYYKWGNGPGDVYGTHQHSYHKVIYVLEGSITFGLPDSGESILLHPGDRLDLPAGVRHNAVVGAHGVACLEGHRQVP
jgi:quercetin dioxygenase-like cupin family protein